MYFFFLAREPGLHHSETTINDVFEKEQHVSKPSILVVEDDTDIQQLVSYNLIKAGFNVTCADTGEEALQLLGREQVDAMVLDLMHAEAVTGTRPGGLVTSGGTGSILHAILAYREYAAATRGIFVCIFSVLLQRQAARL